MLIHTRRNHIACRPGEEQQHRVVGVMGKTIARYTDSIQIVNQTLFISTSVAPLKNELLFQKEKIIQRVNEALGEKVIRDVVIR